LRRELENLDLLKLSSLRPVFVHASHPNFLSFFRANFSSFSVSVTTKSFSSLRFSAVFLANLSDSERNSQLCLTKTLFPWSLVQHIHPHWTTTEEPSTVISERCQRARINSAIFVSSEGRGFDSIEFIRRYGSQSVLCRKAKSAENIPAGNQNVSLSPPLIATLDFNVLFCLLISPQRRFSENPSNKIWESEEPRNSLQHEKIELVECHLEPSMSSSHKVLNSTKKTPKQLLAALPTLSISGPSPAPSRNQSPTSPTEEDEKQNFL
jgi:Domain of unknown function (DUF4808)